MRFSLRTLLIVMLLAGPLCAQGWAYGWKEWQRFRHRKFLERVAIKAAANPRITSIEFPIKTATIAMELDELHEKGVVILGE